MSYFSKEISDVFNELGCDKNGLESKNIEKLTMAVNRSKRVKIFSNFYGV